MTLLLCAIVLSSSEAIRSEAGTLPDSLQLNIHISLLAVCGSAYRRDKGRVGGGRREVVEGPQTADTGALLRV